MDAIALLQHDHREVEQLFRQFEKLTERAHRSKQKIVMKVIRELAIHAAIEEMLFYPAVRTAALKTDVRALKEAADTVLESLEELGERMEKAKRIAPTRPHPRAPDQPPGNLVAGTVAAVMDRAKDMVRGGVVDRAKDMVRGGVDRLSRRAGQEPDPDA